MFLWGLGYKLSLYEVHTPGVHHIPEAKLLSRNEDPNATDSMRHVLSGISKPVGSVLLISMIVFWQNVEEPNQYVAHRDLGLKQPPSSGPNPGLTAFFFRPPPGLIRF